MPRTNPKTAVLRALHPGPLTCEQPLTGAGVVIGRDGQEVDLILHGPDVSRRHAWIGRGPDGNWAIRDLESTNGIFVNGQKIQQDRPLQPGDVIGLGRALAPDYVFSLVSTSDAEQILSLIGDGPWLIGRELKHPVSLPADPTVSKRHARLIRQGSHWIIEDLHSRNGVWINGLRKRRSTLTDSDRVVIGHNQLRLDRGSDRPVIAVRNLATAIAVRAKGLVLGPEPEPVDIQLPAGRLHIVHLPDPARRRELLRLICAPPMTQKDRLEWSDTTLAGQPEQQRDRIALVAAAQPMTRTQTLIAWLVDEAVLAIAGDLSDQRRHELVTTTLEALHLTDRANQRLCDLDRSDQALARLASALLTRPGLLLLDEPAAGLNAEATHRLYQCLEALAGTSLTIVVLSGARGITPQPTPQPQRNKAHSGGRWPMRRPSFAATSVLTRRLLANGRSSPLVLFQTLILPLILLGSLWLLRTEMDAVSQATISLLVAIPMATAWLACHWLPPGLPDLKRRGLVSDLWIAAGLVLGLVILIQCSLVLAASGWVSGWPNDPVWSLAKVVCSGVIAMMIGMIAAIVTRLQPLPALATSMIGSLGLATLWITVI